MSLPATRRLLSALIFCSLLTGLTLPGATGCQAADAGAAAQQAASSDLKALMARTQNDPSDSDLLTFERQHPKTDAEALARLLRGHNAIARANYPAAISALDPSETPSGFILRDYLLFFHGQALFSSRRFGEAVESFDRIVHEIPESPLASDAAAKAAESLLDADKPAQAYESLAKQGQNSAPALIVIAKAEEMLGRREESIATHRKIYFEMPSSLEAETAESRLIGLGQDPKSAGNSTPAQLFSRAEKLYAAGSFAIAEKSFEQLESYFPKQIEDRNLFNLHSGICQLELGQFKAAAARFKLVSVPEPNSSTENLEPEALFHLIEALQRLRLHAEAGSALRVLQSRYGSHAMTKAAIFAAAKSALKSGDDCEAAIWCRRLAENFAGTPEGLEGSFWLAWREHQAGGYRVAAEALLAHVANYRETDYRAKAAFWAAVDFERIGQPAVALALHKKIAERYRYAYYGNASEAQMARIEKTHRGLTPEFVSPGSTLERALANIFRPQAPAETARPDADQRLARALALHAIALDELALSEIEAERRYTPLSPRLNLAIARILAERGKPVAAINELKKAYPDYPFYEDRALPREAWEVFFPLSWWNLIKAEAARYNLDPYLIAGLIRQETVFDPRAVSSANARGMMQILPRTGRLIAKRHGLSPVSAGDLFDPALNIRLGIAFFADLARQFEKVEYASAAYNGGPARVARWIRELPHDSMEEWVESIPITETRLYVQGVLRNAANYRRFYDDSGSFNASPLSQ